MRFVGNSVPRFRNVFRTASLKVLPSDANLRKDLQIVEILHTGAGDAKLNHRLEFFRAAMAPRVA